jgi:branched-subunit amino acid transport protein
MSNNIYIYILVMAITTYLIRALPLTLIRKDIKNRAIRSFLYYVPYVTLAVMTFPAILSATATPWTGLAGFIAATIIALRRGSLFQVAGGACAVVFICELFL